MDPKDSHEQAVKSQRLPLALHEEIQINSVILDGVDAFVVVLDRAGRVVRFNRACERLSGLTFAEVKGRPAAELFLPSELIPQVKSLFARLLAGDSPLTYEHRSSARDGSQRAWSWTGTAVRGGDNEVAFVVCIARDATAEKAAAENVARLNDEVNRLARLTTLGEFTAAVAHELKQPLTAILVHARSAQEWLAAHPPNPVETQAALEAILRDGTRAAQIIHRLRELMVKHAHTKSAVNLSQVLGEIIALQQPDFDQRHIQLRLEVADNLPPVLADPIELQQVMMNLLVNARDALESIQGRSRAVGVNLRLLPSQEIQVEVQDNGPGFAAGDAIRLFTPFFTTKSAGIGMGLPICDAIIKAHGGRLWATQNPAGGATFHFVLPLPVEKS